MLAHAACDTVGPCCEQSGYTYNAAGCRALIAGTSVFQASGTKYDPDAAKRCVDAAKKSSASCEQDPTFSSACTNVYVGTGAPGTECDSVESCAPATGGGGVECVTTSANVTVCHTYARASLDDVCTATCNSKPDGILRCTGLGNVEPGDTACFLEDNLYCSPEGVCVPAPKVGEPCNPPSWCGDGAWCNTTTCEALLPLGSPCKQHSACESNHCNGTCFNGDFASKELCTGEFSYN